MKKLFTLLTLLIVLMAANMAEAKFSDEYRAKYPRRVKVEKRIAPSGKPSQMITYTLFKHEVGAGFLMLRVYDNDGLKLCSIAYGETVSIPKDYSHFSWGDGEKEHKIPRLASYCERKGPNRYQNFMNATVQPSELKKAIVLSTHYNGYYSAPILTTSNKKWEEWIEALDIAETLIKER